MWGPFLAGVVCAGVGSGVLLGWSLGLTQPASLVLGWRVMVPPTAFGFVCVGLGLAIASAPGAASRVQRGAVVCLAAVALVLPLITLFEYLMGVRLGMEAWWGLPRVAGGDAHAGRMSPVTAMAFLLLALALGALPWRAHWSAAAVRLAGGAALTMSWLGTVGLSMDPSRLEDAPRFPGMGVPTVMLFATASVGVLWGSAQAVARLRDEHPARALAPYLLVAAFALPIGLGRAHVALTALVDPGLATALVTAVFSLLVTLVLWRAAAHLQHLHRQRDALLLDLERRVADRTRELDASQHRLRETDRRKDEFLATLAHELRNPLAPIRTGVELLKLDRLPEHERARTHEVIARQMQHLVRLIDDLLDVSRITANKLSLRQDRVDVVEVVHHAIDTAREAVAAAGHELVVVLPPAPAIVTGDATRLTQVVVNLLLNACKYTPTGGRIEIAADLDGPRVTLAVRDNGIGIPAPMLPKLFEKFSQVSPPRDRPEGGLGLGLALVRGIVTLHGGSVEVRSEGSGCGSEFIVRLPLASEDAAASNLN